MRSTASTRLPSGPCPVQYKVVGDGTRFNDRVPMLTRAQVQSISGEPGVRMCAGSSAT